MTSGKTKFQTYNHSGMVHSHQLKKNLSKIIGIRNILELQATTKFSKLD